MNKVYSGEKMQESITNGVNLLADTVKVTLGAKGQLVGLDKKYGGQHLTKDGVTVAKHVETDDPVANFAIKVIRESAQKSADNAGDGTTTVTILSQAIYTFGREAIKRGEAPITIQRELMTALESLKAKVKEKAIAIKQKDKETLAKIATISANNDPIIGSQVADVVSKVGANGIVTVEEQQIIGTEVEYVAGMKIEQGYVSPYFINTDSQSVVLEEAFVLLTDRKIDHINELVPVLQKIGELGNPTLLLIADDFSDNIMHNLLKNNTTGAIRVCAIRNPGFGPQKMELMKDISAVTGAKIFDQSLGMTLGENLTPDDLGSVKKVISTQNETLIIGGRGNTKERALVLGVQAKKAKSEYEKTKIEQRLANMKGNVAIIRIGSATEVETKEIKDRLEDSIRATQAALEEGYLPGGGVAYLNLAEETENVILQEALKKPMLNILMNAGYEEDALLEPFEGSEGKGINVLTGEEDIDMIEAGIIDPAKVVRQCLENSISVATQLLLTKVVIVNEEKEIKNEQV